MSDPRMYPPGAAPGQGAGEPSPEELRAYLEQLRSADPAGLLAEAYNLLATGAQVKLGLPDARLLIDAMGAIVQAAGERVPAELAEQMRQGIVQLQMAQVEAEKEVAGEPAGATAEGASPGTPQPPPTPAEQRMTDRLWIPGRDPGPPPTG